MLIYLCQVKINIFKKSTNIQNKCENDKNIEFEKLDFFIEINYNEIKLYFN
jgi:hypothetical protein